jgi:hypothetical protein
MIALLNAMREVLSHAVNKKPWKHPRQPLLIVVPLLIGRRLALSGKLAALISSARRPSPHRASAPRSSRPRPATYSITSSARVRGSMAARLGRAP